MEVGAMIYTGAQLGTVQQAANILISRRVCIKHKEGAEGVIKTPFQVHAVVPAKSHEHPKLFSLRAKGLNVSAAIYPETEIDVMA